MQFTGHSLPVHQSVTVPWDFNFKIQYMPSKKITHADGLSRLIPNNAEQLEETVIAALKQEQELTEVLINTVSELPVKLEEILKSSKNGRVHNQHE